MPRILVDSAKCVACHSCELACAVAHSSAKTLFGALAETPAPVARVYVEKSASGGFPLQCRHCEDPKCVGACVTKALRKQDASPDSAVIYDRSLCIGCSMCIIACPFGCVEETGKCDLCAETGEPACVASCTTKALSFEDAGAYNKNKRLAYVQGLDLESDGGAC